MKYHVSNMRWNFIVCAFSIQVISDESFGFDKSKVKMYQYILTMMLYWVSDGICVHCHILLGYTTANWDAVMYSISLFTPINVKQYACVYVCNNDWCLVQNCMILHLYNSTSIAFLRTTLIENSLLSERVFSMYTEITKTRRRSVLK